MVVIPPIGTRPNLATGSNLHAGSRRRRRRRSAPRDPTTSGAAIPRGFVSRLGATRERTRIVWVSPLPELVLGAGTLTRRVAIERGFARLPDPSRQSGWR